MSCYIYYKLKVTGDTDSLKKFKKAFKMKPSSNLIDDITVISPDTKITYESMRIFLNRIMLGGTQSPADNKYAQSFEEWISHMRVAWEYECRNTEYEVLDSKLCYKDKNSLVYYLETNREIPYKVLDELYYQWPNLTFENQYFSFDSAFEGYQFAKDGCLVKFTEITLKFDDENPIFKILPKNLLDDFGWF